MLEELADVWALRWGRGSGPAGAPQALSAEAVRSVLVAPSASLSFGEEEPLLALRTVWLRILGSDVLPEHLQKFAKRAEKSGNLELALALLGSPELCSSPEIKLQVCVGAR